jgi:hypothetical protein
LAAENFENIVLRELFQNLIAGELKQHRSRPFAMDNRPIILGLGIKVTKTL